MQSIITSVLAIAMSFSALAQTKNDTDLVELAEDKFKATFVNSGGIKSFEPSPIEGVFQMQTQTGLLYYYPEKELMIFGKIYNKEGVDLTAIAERKHNESVLSDISMEHAFVLGNPDATVSYIEITNPFCRFCIDYHRWAEKQDSSNIKRLVFFQATEGDGKAEAIHILCHPEDYAKIYNREKVSLKTCDEGVTRFEHHSDAMKKMGGVPTPSFIVSGKPFVGFDETILTNLYRKSHVEIN